MGIYNIIINPVQNAEPNLVPPTFAKPDAIRLCTTQIYFFKSLKKYFHTFWTNTIVDFRRLFICYFI